MLENLVRMIVLLVNIIEFTVFTLFMYLLSFVPFMHGSQSYFRLFRFWCKSFTRALGIRFYIHQKNLRALPEHYILIANHPSALEDIGIPALYPVHSLAKIQVKDWFIVGRINRTAGTLYVDRDDPESRRATVDNMQQATESGLNIALYPEGGCTGRRITQEFKRGAFELSLRTGIPIVPVLLYYPAQEDFEWQPPYNLIDKIMHFLTASNKTVEVYQFDAVYPEKFSDKYDFALQMQQFYLDKQTKYLE